MRIFVKLAKSGPFPTILMTLVKSAPEWRSKRVPT